MVRRNLLVVAILSLFIMVLTNPSLKTFKDYLGARSEVGLRRTSNCFLFSTYQCNGQKYIGLFGNFFKIKEKAGIATNQKSGSSQTYGGIDLFGSSTDTLNDTAFNYNHRKSLDKNLDDFKRHNSKKKDK